MLRIFLLSSFFLALCSCVSKPSLVKLPKSKISPSPYFLRQEYYRGAGANFFNDEEEFDRLLAAKRRGISWIRLTPSKWQSTLFPNERGTFLVGRKDHYRGLIEGDVKRLRQVLDWAYSLEIKVVLTFLTVPGRIFAQHNNGVHDKRLWESFEQQDHAVQFFNDIAVHIGDHPALLALNPINEPAPEITGMVFPDWLTGDYQDWGKKIRSSPQDLNHFYSRVVQGIRKVRSSLPIVLDAGFYAHPWAFKVLEPINDPNIYYSFHWYLPFVYSQKDVNYSYPGDAPSGELGGPKSVTHWDKATLERFLLPVVDWCERNNIDESRIMVGEYGINRLVKGAENYLKDVRELFIEHGFLHAFYSFREPHFPRMDYELGVQEKVYPYWQALETGVAPNYEQLRSDVLTDALGLKRLAIKKPLKGFNTWNWFGPDINQNLVMEIMEAMDKKGLIAKGYDTIIIDGGWRKKDLNAEGQFEADESKFPDGIGALVEKAHQRGLKLGVHIPVGTKDCGNKTAGSFGHEKKNAELLQSWGVDVVKLDQCLLDKSEEWSSEILWATFREWHEQLASSKIEIMASASRFWPWYPEYAHYGRTTLDLRPKIFGGARFHEPYLGEFVTVVQAARQNSRFFAKAHEKYLNDPDMLVLENGLSFEESKSHIAMWAMMSAPLIMGNDPRVVSEDILSLLKNDLLLRIHGDPHEQGRLIVDDGEILLFRKRLAHGATAFLFVNLKEDGIVSRDYSFQDLGVLPPQRIDSVFESSLQKKPNRGVSITLKPHDCELIVLD